MTSWHSPQKILNVGHRGVQDMLERHVYMTEKVDGSFFAFGKFDGVLRARSKGKEIDFDAPDKMFIKGIETVKELGPALVDGWTYRGEFLQSPRHNCIMYSRVPERNVILFDICAEEEDYLDYNSLYHTAKDLGLEVVPRLGYGLLNVAALEEMFKIDSVLGGSKIEGVVIKQLDPVLLGPDGKVLMAKYVAPSFREANSLSWKAVNPTAGDVVEQLKATYRSEARWRKAIMHMREQGLLDDSPKDIGPLIKAATEDILAEAKDEIKDALFKWAWPKIQREATRGFPEFYKELLMKEAFSESDACVADLTSV